MDIKWMMKSVMMEMIMTVMADHRIAILKKVGIVLMEALPIEINVQCVQSYLNLT